ncbi:MAG: EAL domain-containing protein [Gammaproteobacteria bacterium]|nr:EAL domain-containing protein [Gammaproteobacteria bacterium]
MKPRILLIELSITRRHAAAIVLNEQTYELTTASSFPAALNEVAVTNKHITKFDAVVFGWPGRTDPHADELLSLLEEPQNRQIAVLVLADQADTSKLNWVTKRERSALLLWEDYQETETSLSALLQSVTTSKTDDTGETKPVENPGAIKILFVDDSPTVRVAFRRLLTEAGYETDTASSVNEAMDLAMEKPYDIAIIDYFMPEDTGDVLCRRLRDEPRTCNISTAIITGTYLERAITDSLEAGAVECMFKNEATELFLARVDAMSRTINGRRKIEQERNRLEGILQSVGDGVYGLDDTGSISFINPAALQILGYVAAEELIGENPCVFHTSQSGSNVENCKLTRAYNEGVPLHSLETFFRHKSNTQVPVECTILPMLLQGKKAGSVVAFRDITERRELENELKWQANHDSLTKLPNRAYFEHQLNSEIKRLQRSEEISALLYLDLDRFKYLNDTAGHATGDRLLVEVSKKLTTRLRASDFLARLGGDEFAIILRNIEPASILEIADGFRRALDDYEFECAGKYYKIGLTAGVNILDKYALSPGDAMACADIACYIAKGNGRNQTHLYDRHQDGKAAMDMELGWSERLHKAIKNNEFLLYYQPILSLQELPDILPVKEGELWQHYCQQNNAARYYEVLIRLPDYKSDVIPPSAFVPTAERFNMMNKIDRWVITRAVENIKNYQLNPNTVLSINLSAQSLEDTDLKTFIQDLLQQHQVSAKQLNFEITETTAISNISAANALISDVSSLGCRFSLDDFGSGYCSFSHLKNLPVDFIKIDGLFVQGLLSDPMDGEIIRSIVNIAHTVGKKTIAEYVDNPETLNALKQTGVDYVQGYYIQRPGLEIG